MDDLKQTIDERDKVLMENAELMEHIKLLDKKIERLRGTIDALAFAVRCNGVSGGDVRFDV